MCLKSQCFEKFKAYKTETETHHEKYIKSLRSDRGREYLLQDFRDYISESGIISQLSAPGTPQQNGVADRRNKTLTDIVR